MRRKRLLQRIGGVKGHHADSGLSGDSRQPPEAGGSLPGRFWRGGVGSNCSALEVPREGGLSQKFKLSISGSITSSAMISQFCTLGRGRTAKPNPNKGLAYRILRRKVVSALIPNYYLAFEPSQSDQWSCMKTTHDSIQNLPLKKAKQFRPTCEEILEGIGYTPLTFPENLHVPEAVRAAEDLAMQDYIVGWTLGLWDFIN